MLRRERKKRHLTQGELAERAKLKLAYVKKIESGQAHPSKDARDRIRKVLSVCPVCANFGQTHKLEVPDDEDLYVRPARLVHDDD